MKIGFRLGWARGPVAAKHFKSKACHELFSEYLGRIGHFVPAAGCGIDLKKDEKGRPLRWFCHSSKQAKTFSSEELSRAVERMRSNGTREWEVVVGPSDGFSADDLDLWKPDVLWSFGPMTLPHELAAVVAAEQVYRAFTILGGLPYHSGH